MTRRLLGRMIALTILLGSPTVVAQNRAGDIGAAPIEGSWMVTGAERDGTPWREIAGATMTIGSGQFTLQFAGSGAAYKGEVKQSGGAQEIDFIQREGPESGKTWQALVSSNGQLLKICFNYSGDGPRPNTLTTSPGEGTTLMGLRRR